MDRPRRTTHVYTGCVLSKRSAPTMTRILVMDDDALLRAALRTVLEAADYDVLEAADGEAGLRLYHERGADLVVVDIFMPERDGLEVIRALRAAVPGPKILAMSGGGQSAQLEILKAAAVLGADRTLRKPFQPHQLLTAIGDLLGIQGP